MTSYDQKKLQLHIFPLATLMFFLDCTIACPFRFMSLWLWNKRELRWNTLGGFVSVTSSFTFGKWESWAVLNNTRNSANKGLGWQLSLRGCVNQHFFSSSSPGISRQSRGAELCVCHASTVGLVYSVSLVSHLGRNDFWQGYQDHSMGKKQSFQQMVLRKLGVHIQKNEVGP
jgi:hypothetical protein